jgi:hypothetical protein
MTTLVPFGRLTAAESRLVGRYVRVLDCMSHCAQAVDHGDWSSLAAKARQLQDAAGRLSEAVRQQTGADRPRAQATRAAVAWFGRHYPAGRLLHPNQPTPRRGERP